MRGDDPPALCEEERLPPLFLLDHRLCHSSPFFSWPYEPISLFSHQHGHQRPPFFLTHSTRLGLSPLYPRRVRTPSPSSVRNQRRPRPTRARAGPASLPFLFLSSIRLDGRSPLFFVAPGRTRSFPFFPAESPSLFRLFQGDFPAVLGFPKRSHKTAAPYVFFLARELNAPPSFLAFRDSLAGVLPRGVEHFCSRSFFRQRRPCAFSFFLPFFEHVHQSLPFPPPFSDG